MTNSAPYNKEIVGEYFEKGFWQPFMGYDYCRRNAELYPDKEALVDFKARLTWYEVNDFVGRIATAFVELGVKHGEAIALLSHNCAELYLIRIACEKAGVVLIQPLPTFRHREIRHMLSYPSAVAVVISEQHHSTNFHDMIGEVRSDIPSLRDVIVLGSNVFPDCIAFDEIVKSAPVGKYPEEYFNEIRINSQDWSIIGSSTGTTGMPKLVETACAPRQFSARVINQLCKYNSTDVHGVFLPAHSGTSEIVYWEWLMSASKLVIAKEFTPESLFQIIESERVTTFRTVPTVILKMIDHPDISKHDLSSLRLVLYGGAGMSSTQIVEVERKLGAPLLTGYGAMEQGLTAHVSLEDSPEVRYKTVGKPLEGMVVKIVDNNMNEVPNGEVGEVVVRGPHCCSRYYEDPDAMNELWRGGYCHMGDLGQFDDHGNLIIIGRLKQIIIRGGQNIFPGEVEELLLQHPKIMGVAVVGMPDPVMGEKACAYIKIRPGEELKFDEMTQFLRDKKIAPYKIPERLELIDEFPLAGGQKVNKRILQEDINRKLEAERRVEE